MSKVRVYVEVQSSKPVAESMGMFSARMASPVEAVQSAEAVLAKLDGFGLEIASESPPIPMFSDAVIQHESMGFATFSAPFENPDVAAESFVVLCECRASELDKLTKKSGVSVFAFQEPELFGCGCAGSMEVAGTGLEDVHPFDLAMTAGGIDCAPFRPGVDLATIRQLLGVSGPWNNGFSGQNTVVAIIDEGVNSRYPVIGGMTRAGAFPPGGAPITSHGSMCAADVLVAAPSARLLDYPIFNRSGQGLDPLPVWTAILNKRRQDGTPHLTNNSYGYYTIPPTNLGTPATDPNHPVNRAIRSVVAAGIPCFFAAGNCGAPCPSRSCNNGTGQPVRINGSNSLPEVMTVAAVNSRRERIGYSSQGPGNFATQKPDFSAYSHFFGNFGPGRPGGTASPFDNGTSAACPVACGVGALLRSAFPRITPAQLATVLRRTAINIGQPGFDTDTGFGVISAGAAYAALQTSPSAALMSVDLTEEVAEYAPEAAATPSRRRRNV